MERLTENVGNGVRLKECGNSICMAICNSKRDCSVCPIDEAFRKLADYEELEEQGLLVRLPCKVGDVLYCIDNGIVETLIVNSFRIYNFNRVEIDFENASGFALCTFAGELDEGYFLSREEAEKKLEELGNDKT